MPTATPTPLERQQIQVAAPDAQTFWHTVRFELVGRIAEDVRAATILDIGAGSGLLGSWLRLHRPVVRYRFEETSAVLAEALDARFGREQRGDPTAPIPASTLVVMLDVLEHIDDDRSALRAVAARMEPGATLVLTVPALQWAFSSWDEQLGHFRRYSRASLREVAESAGLHVLECDYLFPELLPLLPLRKLRRSDRESADFPQLGPRLTRFGHRLGTVTSSLRRIWPAGTSLLLVARREPRGRR